MKPWELIDSATIPGSDGTMRLMRRDQVWVIQVDNQELMRSTVHASEEALAHVACEGLQDELQPRILIGGLGMGYTLAAALACLGHKAQVVVAELVPAVIRWNRTFLREVAGRPLEDGRADVYEGDVDDLVRQPPAPWDAILLDVDNGPAGLTRATNDQLYSSQGLQRAFRALKPGGLLAVWSATRDQAFGRRLERARFTAQCLPLRARGSQGGRRQVVWLGRR
jgi:spermidine synthase